MLPLSCSPSCTSKHPVMRMWAATMWVCLKTENMHALLGTRTAQDADSDAPNYWMRTGLWLNFGSTRLIWAAWSIISRGCASKNSFSCLNHDLFAQPRKAGCIHEAWGAQKLILSFKGQNTIAVICGRTRYSGASLGSYPA